MRPVAELTSILDGRTALVLGKGPSLTEASYREHCDGKVVIGINQTVKSFRCDITFFIDIEPFIESLEEVERSESLLILPWRPNQRHALWQRVSKPTIENLEDLCTRIPALERINSAGRLFYFHTRMNHARRAQNVFEPNLVSLSALLKILASLNVADVRTLGVDGGRGISSAVRGSRFTQLRQGYDKQFPILRQIAMESHLSLTRADSKRIPIFVGAEPEQALAGRVLEYSIRKHTNESVEIRQLHELVRYANGRTPFSCQRFFVPGLCDYRGLAIYLDSDMQLFADIRDLVALYVPGNAVMSAQTPPESDRRPQYSVMLINCELAKWNGPALTEKVAQDYEGTMFQFEFEPRKSDALPYVWNSLERYEPGITKLLHYTDMDLQPWISNRNPLARVWISALIAAVRDGFISFDEVRRAVVAGHVRPGLLYQVEAAEPDPFAIPKRERLKDEMYVPPHTVARFSRRNTPIVRGGLAVAKRLVHAIRGSRL